MTEPDGGGGRGGRSGRAPEGPGRLDVAARVGLVVVLLGLAAHGLSSRRDLDWAALDNTPDSPWVGLLLATLAGAVVAAAARTLIRMLRKVVSAGEDDDETAPLVERRSLPWWLWGLAALLVLLALTSVFLVVRQIAVDPPGLPAQPDPLNGPGAGRPGGLPVSAISLLAVLLGGAAVLLYFGSQMLSARRAARAGTGKSTDDDPIETEALAVAVTAAGDELDLHDDDRAAIIAAYATMEHQLAALGTTRHVSDTPTDFLRRAVAAGRVSRGAATRLTELFREARFSTHPMPPGARADAARALARVAADLTDVRA